MKDHKEERLMYLSDPDLEIVYFSPHSTHDILEKACNKFSSTQDILENLRFAIRDRPTKNYILPLPGHETICLHNHAPFTLSSLKHKEQYRLVYSSVVYLVLGETTDFKKVLMSFPQPWKVQFLIDSQQTSNIGFFDKLLPKRLDKIISY